jgi:hypothetical protein
MTAPLHGHSEDDCSLKIARVWECPLCLRQSATLEGEDEGCAPFICDSGHRRVEMEQRTPGAFVASRQGINWDADGR